MVSGMAGQQLSWQTSYSLVKKPMRKSRQKRKRPIFSDGTTSFEFVEVQHGQSCSTDSFAPKLTSNGCTATPNSSISYGSREIDILSHPAALRTDPGNDESELKSIRSPLSAWNDERCQLSPASNTLSLTNDDTISEESNVAAQGVVKAFKTTYATDGYESLLPQAIQYDSLFDRLLPVLQRYEFEFCKTPLTTDMVHNPFDCRATLSPRRTFLLHAVLTLAGHHVNSSETQNHRFTALHAFRKRLDDHQAIMKDLGSMLDTIVILFSLDETQPNMGNWRTHLLGALSLLEAIGGPRALLCHIKCKSKLACSLGMSKPPILHAGSNLLLNFSYMRDAIISLVSREHPVLPYVYFEAVMSSYDDARWSYFGLCGCPLELVRAVMQLAQHHSRHPSAAPCLDTTDLDNISRTEADLESWIHTPPDDIDGSFVEESMQQDQDKMHCSEAWRHDLLLYIYRVFKWTMGDHVPIRVLYRARTIVDHVFACRYEEMVAKQALLPLFFAGCELQDQALRQQILDFCTTWDLRTRYHVFGNIVPLLQEIWAAQKSRGFDNVWWGQIVDEKYRASEDHPLQKRTCFG